MGVLQLWIGYINYTQIKQKGITKSTSWTLLLICCSSIVYRRQILLTVWETSTNISILNYLETVYNCTDYMASAYMREGKWTEKDAKEGRRTEILSIRPFFPVLW